MCSWAARSSDNNLPVINQIMLRFRPIAPKPIGEGASGAAEQDRGSGGGRRAKRKYVRARSRQSKQRCRKEITEGKKKSSPEKSGVEDESSPEKGVAVTLQLLPERSESDYNSCNSSERNTDKENRKTDRCKFDDDVDSYDLTVSGGGSVDLRRVGRSVVETWIIMECVTDKFTDIGLGFSDEEKIYNLEHDTCPGFVSDRRNNVIWVNDAYRKMLAEEQEQAVAEEEEQAAAAAAEKGLRVRLVVKEEIPYFYPSFACRVRVIQQRGHGQKWNKIVPCDVWRMEFGGFAWKLDVNTALSLSL